MNFGYVNPTIAVTASLSDNYRWNQGNYKATENCSYALLNVLVLYKRFGAV